MSIKAKVYKAEIYIVDVDNEFRNFDDILNEMERTVDFSISAFNVKESDEIDWYDEIDLNKTNCTKETFDKYFLDK
jgi:aspartyl/asparaginyl-tRNA synthetase